MQFSGSYTAIITPFRDGKVDAAALQDFVAWQIREGSSGVVPCGTTGESPTLSHDEHKRVVELSVEAAAGKAPVIAGAGSNSTAEAIDLMRHAERAGADAALVVCPYYNRPTQEGLYQHYKAIHDATGLPIVIYNIPGRTGVDMSIETMRRLAELPRIVGVKDATGDLARPLRMRLAAGPDFAQLSGEDITVLPFLVQGGVGCISTLGNVAPGLVAEMHAAWRSGDIPAATRLNERLAPLADSLFAETNPTPVKYAVSLLGRCEPTVRPPLLLPSEPVKRRIEEAMRQAGVLN
jgi:4-hydroxy-tetrahydrodipicolinate synthase